MRLAKIKNRYLFKSDSPDGVHTYGVYYDRKSRGYRAVAFTHLYVKDDKRFVQVRRGNIKVERFKEFDTPTGVKNYYHSKNITGGKIDLKHKDVLSVTKRYLNKKQSDRIKRFAAKDYNK